MDEKEYLKLTGKVMSDETPLIVHMQIKDIWILDSVLALAYRHPGLTDFLKAWIVKMSKQFRQPIIDLHPEAAVLLEMGWHEENDQPIDYDRQKRTNEMMDNMLKKYRRKTGRK